jgi:4-amino-4-deoxy-L-arabinose transferase-like glycosyltransferase
MPEQLIARRDPNITGSLLFQALLVFLLALVARLLFQAWRGPGLSPDTSEYLTLAHNLVAHHSFSLQASAPFIPSIRRPPAYPGLLAVLELIGSFSPGWIIGVQAAFDSAVAMMILFVTRQVAPLRWALVAAIFYTVHPGAIYATTTILSEPFFTFVLTCAVALLIFGLKKDRLFASIGGGLFMGGAILCRPIVLLLPFVLLGLLIFIRSRARQPQHAIAFLIMSAMVVLPWSVRTSKVSGQLVLVQGYGANNYWAPTVLFLDQRDEHAIWSYEAEILKEQMPDASYSPQKALQADRFLMHEALANIRANPRGYLISRLRAYPYLFFSSFDNFSGFNKSFGVLWAEHDFTRIAAKGLLLLLFSALPLLLALFGFCFGRRNLFVVIISSVWLYMLAVHLPLWIEYRFWVPVVPFLVATAAVGGDQVLTRIKARAQH